MSSKNTRSDNDNPDIFYDLSSKIKKVVIELYNYNYFHGPSEVRENDTRFIGRKKLIHEIKTIILNSKKKTGAYLITGYRGMGKSSAINNALNQIERKSNALYKLIQQILLVFIISFILNVIAFLLFKDAGIDGTNLVFPNLIYILIIFSVVVALILTILLGFRNFIKLFFFERNPDNIINLKSVTALKYFVIATLVLITTYLFAGCFKTNRIIDVIKNMNSNLFIKNYYLVFGIYALTQILYFFKLNIFKFTKETIGILNTILSIIKSAFKKEENVIDSKNNINIQTNKLRAHIYNYFSRSKTYIYVNINLSYEQLQVRDVLRLISNKTEDEYSRFIGAFNMKFFWRRIIIWYFPILLLTHFMYHYKPIYILNQKMLEQLHVFNFLPSQMPVAVFNEKNYFNSINLPNNSYYKSLLNKIHNDNQEFVTKSLKLFSKKTTYKELHTLNDTTIYTNDSKNIFPFKIKKVEKDKYEPIFKLFQRAIITGDIFIYNMYFKLRTIINYFLFNKLDSKHLSPARVYSPTQQKPFSIKGVFLHIDYLYIFYFFLTSFIIRIVFSSNIFGLYSNKKILRRLKKLNQSINSEIKREEGLIEKNYFHNIMSLFSRNVHTYPLTDEREIENQLIKILNDMQSVSFIFPKPSFIYVFDELDKIQPFDNYSIELKEKENERKKENISITPGQIRIRQKTVFNLFSNLKYFLTTAKAKFFFIGGRELYDAYLADISDRNFFIGSIFHKVFYVESFLSDRDSDRPLDITSMTEKYVCQFLFPESYISKKSLKVGKSLNLKSYNTYLKDTFLEFNDEKQENELRAVIAKQKREKIIYTLKQFIVFLTHVSNGSPKKITMFFEENLMSFNSKRELLLEKDKLNVLPVIKTNNLNTLYLSFDYLTQYKFGLIYYLMNPVILSFINSKKNYGDKLLVSASFLLDYLYKFHRGGFSWRNLEHTPEIININKTPELRNFIYDIISYLKKSHIEEILSGLYQYKFSKRVNRDITFLSRTREDIAAAFNFTLDESLILKQYFKRELDELYERFNGSYGNNKFEFIHSIASQHFILGDLHFLDEEYNEAIIEYQNSIHFLKNTLNSETSEKQLTLLLILFRTMMKLGLSFEKRRTYNSAFTTYGELIELFYHYIATKTKRVNSAENDQYKTVIENLTSSSLENLRLFYQPTLARLFIIEKSNFGGISTVNVNRVLKDMEYLERLIPSSEKYIIKVEFYNKLSDILFFKNSSLAEEKKSKKKDISSSETKLLNHICNYKPFSDQSCETKSNLLGCRKKRSSKDNAFIGQPCWSCFINSKSLNNIISNFLNAKIKNNDPLEIKIKRIATAFDKKNYKSNRPESFILLGKVLSNYADTLLSCIKPAELLIITEFIDFFNNGFFDLIENKNYNKIKDLVSGTKNKFKSIIVLIYLSAISYKKANKLKEYSFQLSKILHIVKEYMAYRNESVESNTILKKDESNELSKLTEKFINSLERIIVKKVIKGYYLTYDNVHRLEISSQKDIFTKDDVFFGRKDISLARISITDEIEEVLLTFSSIKLLTYSYCFKINKDNLSKNYKKLIKYLTQLFKNNVIGSYNLNDNAYNRILRLAHKQHINYLIYLHILGFPNQIEFEFETKFIESFNKIISNESNESLKNLYSGKPLDLLEFLINDSIFSLLEVIKLSKLYDYTYLLNHSFIGYMHHFLSQWIYIYKHLSMIYRIKGYSIEKDKEKIHNYYVKVIKLKINIKKGEFKSKLRNNNSTNNYNSYNNKLEKLENLGSRLDKLNSTSLNKLETIELEELKTFNDSFYSKVYSLFKNEKKKCREYKLQKKRFEKKLFELIEKGDIIKLSSNFHTEQAINHFYSAQETHMESVTYRNFMEKMFFLNDDLNDNLDHFFAATERFRINSERIVRKREELKRLYKYSQVYYFNNYMITK